jgi:hypothetical protein
LTLICTTQFLMNFLERHPKKTSKILRVIVR